MAPLVDAATLARVLAPPPTPTIVASAPPRSNIFKVISTVLGAAFLLFLGLAGYNYIRRRQGLPELKLTGDTSSGDQTPSPVDGTTRVVIDANRVPVGGGMDFGMQFWMFIKDWDYRFSQEKSVIKRVQGDIASPDISLHPTDNTLQVRIALYPTNTQGASPTGDSFTCTVENVPLQSWFSVSLSVFGRNLEIYINGRLVKACALPGIPRPVSGDVILGDAGGFSGSICNFHSYASMLSPETAKAFFAAGTRCQAPSPTVAEPIDKDSVFVTLFGYTFRFSTLDKTGKELSSYTL